MTIPVLGTINWTWLIIGALLGWFVLPGLTSRLGV